MLRVPRIEYENAVNRGEAGWILAEGLKRLGLDGAYLRTTAISLMPRNDPNAMEKILNSRTGTPLLKDFIMTGGLSSLLPTLQDVLLRGARIHPVRSTRCSEENRSLFGKRGGGQEKRQSVKHCRLTPVKKERAYLDLSFRLSCWICFASNPLCMLSRKGILAVSHKLNKIFITLNLF